MPSESDVIAVLIRALEKDPNIGPSNLREKAEKFDSGIRRVGNIVFYSRFISPAKQAVEVVNRPHCQEEKETSMSAMSPRQTEKHDKVCSALAGILKRNPETTNTRLRERAEKVDPSIKKLSNRAFHGRYALPSKRRAGLIVNKPSRRKGKSQKGSKPVKRKAKKKAGAKKKSVSTRKPQTTGISREAARGLILDRDRGVIATLRSGDAQAGYDLVSFDLERLLDELGF